jgi:hypothetical protein
VRLRKQCQPQGGKQHLPAAAAAAAAAAGLRRVDNMDVLQQVLDVLDDPLVWYSRRFVFGT